MRIFRDLAKGVKRYFVYRMGYIFCDDELKPVFVFLYGLFVALIALFFFIVDRIENPFVLSVSIYSLFLSKAFQRGRK